MSNEWTHGHFACCNDGFVPCLCQQGMCAVCAYGRTMDILEGGDGSKFIMWSVISWLFFPCAEFMIRRKRVILCVAARSFFFCMCLSVDSIAEDAGRV